MSEFAVVINYQFLNEKAESIVLDAVSDTNVSSSASVTSQPLPTGDEVIDHMYREPKTLTLRGAFSMNGSKGIFITRESSTLVNFEQLFERIQKEAVKCNIVKVSMQNEEDIRFVQRNNMILNSIQWTEKINSVDFTLSFVEVISVDVEQFVPAPDDEFLPNITVPQTKSFSNTLIDWTQIDATIVQCLKYEQLITPAFENFMKSFGKTAGATTVVGAVALIVAAFSATAGIGVAIVGAIIFWKGIVGAIKNISRKRKYAIKQFKYYKNSKKNKAEAERFADFLLKIHKELEVLNNQLQVYQISEDGAQECLMSINDEYFTFTFNKNNVSKKYDLNIQNSESTNLKFLPDVTTCPSDWSECLSTNYLIKTSNNERVYLVCPSEEKDVLTNYFILISQINPEQFNEEVEKIIKNAIFK